MRAVRAIAANTFREAIRDRILYLFIGFAVVMVVSSKLFGMLTVGDEAKIVKDIGLASMRFFSMLIAVMMSMILISREVDNRTVFNILAKPVRRWQFILGKYLGLVTIVAANLLLITLVLIVMVLSVAGEFDLMLLFAGAMTMLEMLVLAAFATFFAVLTRPILGSLMTLAVFVVGHLSSDLWLLTQHLERFNFDTEVVHDLSIPGAAVGWAVIYAAAFVAVVLFLANLRFRGKDLK
jgi:ABC-type transport system involved in multi-copper enzyme maturation permease subunit